VTDVEKLEAELGLSERESKLMDLAEERAMRRFDPQHLRLVRAVAAIGVILLIGTTVGWVAIDAAVDSIQQNRYELTRDGCLDQNGRNHETLLRLAEVSHDGPASADLTERERRGIEASKVLINAIIPARPDCEAYARSRISR